VAISKWYYIIHLDCFSRHGGIAMTGIRVFQQAQSLGIRQGFCGRHILVCPVMNGQIGLPGADAAHGMNDKNEFYKKSNLLRNSPKIRLTY